MIRPINVTINAANPELPLEEATAFVGAPSAVFVRGVPKNCGNWRITAVSVAVTYPDNATTTRTAVESAEGVWVATIPGTATTGRTAAGFRILADGIDENGAAVTGYVLGWADFSVSSFLPVPAPGGTFYYVRIFDAMPTTPRKGDTCEIGGALKWYNGTAWVPFGGGDMSHYQFASLPAEDLSPEDVGLPEICNLLNAMKNLLRPAALAILAAFAIAAPTTSTAASVETNKLVNLKGSSNVVTRVDLSGLATTSGVASATNALEASLLSRLSQSSRASTNYTDSATNKLVRALTTTSDDAIVVEHAHWADSAETAESASSLQDRHSGYHEVDDVLAQLDAAIQTNAQQSAEIANRYTIAQTEDAIDALAAYYITTSNGQAFASYAALTNATVYYSGGEPRTPTRNDYAVVLADETHGTNEWRYIYTVSVVGGVTNAQWEAQYPIETNDYEALTQKPSINGVELSGNKTAAQLGLLPATPPADGYGPYNIEYAIRVSSFSAFLNGLSIYSNLTLNGDWSDLSADGGNAPQSLPDYLDEREQALTNNLATKAEVAFATNALDVSLSSRLSQESQNSTNYTDTAIATADTSYRRFSFLTNLNQTVQYVTTAPGGTLEIQFPTGDDATKDWIVYAYFGNDTPLVLPAGNWWMADEAYTNAIPADTPTAFYFSQVATGIFTISRQELKTLTITNP